MMPCVIKLNVHALVKLSSGLHITLVLEQVQVYLTVASKAEGIILSIIVFVLGSLIWFVNIIPVYHFHSFVVIQVLLDILLGKILYAKVRIAR